MPYRPKKYFSGRAFPALLFLLLLIPFLFSCSRDKGKNTPVATDDRSQVLEPTAQAEQGPPVASHGQEPGPGAPQEEAGNGGIESAVAVPDEADSDAGDTAASSADPSSRRFAQNFIVTERESSFEAGMNRREGGHFLVKFEGGENSVAGHLIGLLLEEAYLKVGSDLGLYPEERIEALLYSREAFRDITRSPSWAGAIYDGRIKLPAGGITEKTSALESVIFHEYTHAVVRELSNGRAPVWLNEGLAQYEEGQSSTAYARALSGLASKGALRLRPLEGSFMGLRAQEAQTAYILSLSATEYIVREFGLFSVRSILERLGEGMGLDEAISATLGVTYEELEKGWAASLMRP